MKASELKTIYVRPALRLPKLMALAVLLDWIKQLGLPKPEVVMLAENLQPTGEGIYTLDCHGNGYRDRAKGRQEYNEIDVIMEDFNIPDGHKASPEYQEFAALVDEHNTRNTSVNNGGSRQRSTRNRLNRNKGSIGWFTGSAWDVIDQVTQGNWKWNEEPVIDDDGALVLGPNGEVQFERRAQRESLTTNDFLWMCLEVLFTAMNAAQVLREGEGKYWNESEAMKSKTIAKLLNGTFQGRSVRSGNFDFPTLSRYIRNLYELGTPVKEIQAKLRPWLRIWRVLENCLEEGKTYPPHYHFSFMNGGKGVVFDLLPSEDNELPEEASNPLIHQAWLDNELANCVIVRRPSGHIAVFTRNVDYKTVATLAETLQKAESGTWVYEDGGVIFNGSKSRVDAPVTRIPAYLETQVKLSISLAASRCLKKVVKSSIPARKYASVR